MQIIQKSAKAVFDFIVGDARLLIGTILTLAVVALIIALVGSAASTWVGVVLFIALAATLTIALRREVK